MSLAYGRKEHKVGGAESEAGKKTVVDSRRGRPGKPSPSKPFYGISGKKNSDYGERKAVEELLPDAGDKAEGYIEGRNAVTEAIRAGPRA